MEEEIIQVDLLPNWLKVGTKIRVIGGKSRCSCGYVTEVIPRIFFKDDEYRVRCNIPGVGLGDFYIKHLEKHPLPHPISNEIGHHINEII